MQSPSAGDPPPDTQGRPRPTAEARKPQPKKPEPKKPEPRPEHQDKITMILHPAPKAAPNRRSKKKDRPRTAKEAMQAKTAKRAPAGKAASRPKTAATTELQQAWLDADIATAADAVQAAGGSAGALVQAWLERSNAAAIACVASLDSVGGGIRRAARKALDALKERGVDIPEHGREAEGPDPHVATFIPPDGSGATFLSISQRQPGGRYHVADVVMRTPAGVVHASSAKLAGKHIRDWRNRIEKQYGAKPVEVSVDWARHRIAEARKLNDSSGQLVPLGFESCAALFADTPQDAPPHPISDLEEAAFDKTEIEKAVLGSDEIHAHPELRSWLPDKAAVDELLSKVGQAVGGDEGASDSKVVDEALRTETTAATDRYFTPELRSALVDRMRDTAISVRARVGDEPARRMLAVAQAVRDAGLITSPPSEIPFLLSYFQKAVARLVRQGQGQLRVPVAPTP